MLLENPRSHDSGCLRPLSIPFLTLQLFYLCRLRKNTGKNVDRTHMRLARRNGSLLKTGHGDVWLGRCRRKISNYATSSESAICVARQRPEGHLFQIYIVGSGLLARQVSSPSRQEHIQVIGSSRAVGLDVIAFSTFPSLFAYRRTPSPSASSAEHQCQCRGRKFRRSP